MIVVEVGGLVSKGLKSSFSSFLNIGQLKMEYREIETVPEDIQVSVVWGEQSEGPEYGSALKLESWYIYGQSNPHANGRPCAEPDGWLPKDRQEWTKAERRLCDILALHPDL